MRSNTPNSRTWVRTTIVIIVGAVALSACASKSEYDALLAENQQLKAQLAQSQAQQNFVEAGDTLFPPGGYQLTSAGQTELKKNIVPRLKAFKDVKIVVYGYTDNTPIGAQLQQAGIPDNLVLSTRRASTVANFLVSQGIDANIVSAKGFGDTHPIATNDTPEGRAQNRRIVITVQGPGAAES
ncbi:MAG TPA: OmpA family protein [Alphaproteobacteria bacterium]|nr:OmpA family protein [Alphaproteobacteria bacterium]